MDEIGLSQDDVAKAIKKDRKYVRNRM
jgi:hypothetical protein